MKLLVSSGTKDYFQHRHTHTTITMFEKIMKDLFGGESQQKRHHSRRLPPKVAEEPARPHVHRPRASKDQKKRNKEVADGVRYRLTLLPKGTDEADVPSDLREDFIGIVVPMGSGKTFMSGLEGWVDFDSLIKPQRREILWEEVYTSVSGGADMSESLREISAEAMKTLQLLRPASRTVLLVQHHAILHHLKVQCVGCVSLSPEVAMEVNGRREEHEKLLMQKNMQEVFADRSTEVTPYTAMSFSDVRWYIYNICEHFGMCCGAPDEFGVDFQGVMDHSVTDGKAHDLNRVVELYEAGKIPSAVVDYQVRLHKMRSYKTFGFTMNDWAEVMCRVSCAQAAGYDSDQDWTGWPISLNSLSKDSDLSQHDDVSHLLKVHSGEHERFIVTLILHWKGLGISSGLGARIFPLYSIKRVHWLSIFCIIKESVIRSGAYMGLALTKPERDVLLNMGLLSVGSAASLSRLVDSAKVSSPRRHPGRESVEEISRGLDRVVYAPEDRPMAEAELGINLAKSSLPSLVRLDWSPGNLGKMKRVDSISLCIGLELTSRWTGQPGAVNSINGLMHRICTKWFKAGIIRDEWSDMISELLDQETESHTVSHAIAAAVSCDMEDGMSGMDWSLRMLECFKGFVACTLVAGKHGRVLLNESRGHRSPCVLGMSEAEIWRSVAKNDIPKNSLGCFSSGFNILQEANELCKWVTNPTICLLEMINSESWAPDLSRRLQSGLMLRWKHICTGVVDGYLLENLLDSYSRKVYGKKFSRVESRLSTLSRMKRTDGGLECATGTVHRGRVSLGKDGFWDGHGDVKLGREYKRDKADETVESLIESYSDVGRVRQNDMQVSSKSIYAVGLAACVAMRERGHQKVSQNCKLLLKLARGD